MRCGDPVTKKLLEDFEKTSRGKGINRSEGKQGN